MDKELIKEMRQAIKKNELDRVKLLIDSNKGMLETVTPFGTFLHDAATYGKYEIAEFLIECGIDVNKEGGVHHSGALTDAAFGGYINIVELLYENGAMLDTSSFAANPLFAAIYDDHYDVVKFLVEKGIDISATYAIGSIDHCDACEYARLYGRTEIYNYLKALKEQE